ncbi:hypothetical protein [Alkalicoccus halolimnae]|jgi:hypothetical protein|uniref:Uncharacterized protein n=1 Tax=Alkalicoccus halolimnae TaxID=1667239 RepID=A0A5C7FHG8_9BACI|nr:hypothetical protein [Alkalicoccus halolimnae]TXF85589.1 hypothetical protein FTX54_08350 [Alkalicoccus halolimnae]
MKYDGSYHELREAAVSVLHRLSEILNINTVYIAENDKEQVKVVHAYNHKYTLVESGYQVSYEDSY